MKIAPSSPRAGVRQLDNSVSQCLAMWTGACLAASPPLLNLRTFKHLQRIPRLKRVGMADATMRTTKGENNEMMSMRMHASLPLILLLGASILPERANAQANTQSNPASSPSAADPDSSSWLFPIEKLDEALPSWLHIGGEYRNRLEGPLDIGYQRTNDFYLL